MANKNKEKKEKKKMDRIKHSPHNACSYAVGQGRRIPELEKIIMRSSKEAYRYAFYVIKGRWIEAEPIIAIDDSCCVDYADKIIGGRWDYFEENIFLNLEAYRGTTLVLYAKRVIKGRWEEMESEIISRNAGDFYADNIIGGRWKKFEEEIFEQDWGDWRFGSLHGYVDIFGLSEEMKQKISSLSLDKVKLYMSVLDKHIKGDFLAKPRRVKRVEEAS